jgi:hypothetical protein
LPDFAWREKVEEIEVGNGYGEWPASRKLRILSTHVSAQKPDSGCPLRPADP